MKRRTESWRGVAVAILYTALLLPGCVYYNKFYSAKKSFNQAENLTDRPDARPTPQQVQLYDKALRGATRVVVEHPTSGWVDDAVLMMGRSLIGKGDYQKAREKFEEFYRNFPDSPLMDQAIYYHGEAFRREREWKGALARYDSLRAAFPMSQLLAAAAMQTGKIYIEEGSYADGLARVRPVAQRGGDLELDARLALAEGYFRSQRYDSAAAEYRWVSGRTRSAEVMNETILRYGECLEKLSRFEEAVRVYEEWEKQTPNMGYKDKARIRVGGAHATAGDVEKGIQVLESVAEVRRRTPSAAEALFQIAYIQEVHLDDFKAARATYAKVEEEGRNTTFAQQAKHRRENLDRIEQLRAVAADDSTGLGGPAAAAFNLAEHYYFELANPGRSLEEYGRVEREYPQSPFAAKAAFAGAWLLERKLERAQEADSAWRHVAATYPETDYGRAARLFLGGEEDSLRQIDRMASTRVSGPLTAGAAPYVKPAAKLNVQSRKLQNARTTAGGVVIDSLAREFGVPPTDTLAVADTLQREVRGDTLGVALPDTSRPQSPDTTQAASLDSTWAAPPDSVRFAAPDTGQAPPPDSSKKERR